MASSSRPSHWRHRWRVCCCTHVWWTSRRSTLTTWWRWWPCSPPRRPSTAPAMRPFRRGPRSGSRRCDGRKVLARAIVTRRPGVVGAPCLEVTARPLLRVFGRSAATQSDTRSVSSSLSLSPHRWRTVLGTTLIFCCISFAVQKRREPSHSSCIMPSFARLEPLPPLSTLGADSPTLVLFFIFPHPPPLFLPRSSITP